MTKKEYLIQRLADAEIDYMVFKHLREKLISGGNKIYEYAEKQDIAEAQMKACRKLIAIDDAWNNYHTAKIGNDLDLTNRCVNVLKDFGFTESEILAHNQ